MEIIRQAADFGAGRGKVALAIGMFDGVHLGHQQVLRQAISDAERHEGVAVAVSFHPHPNRVVAPERTPPLIYPLSKKLRLLEALGIRTTLLLEFDRRLSEQRPAQFVQALTDGFGPILSASVGARFLFGRQRSGTAAVLQDLGGRYGFVVHSLATVALDGKAVSSTRIREAIRTGDLDHATQMLGRTYALVGTVRRGDGLGKQWGFPTANLEVSELALPPTGVYAAQAHTREKVFRSVVNIGWRPTLEAPRPLLRVEAHLLNFEGDLYGQEMELTFVEKLREEMKFDSLTALQEQIRRDASATEKIFAG